jgi:hypothetical protein
MWGFFLVKGLLFKVTRFETLLKEHRRFLLVFCPRSLAGALNTPNKSLFILNIDIS